MAHLRGRGGWSHRCGAGRNAGRDRPPHADPGVPADRSLPGEGRAPRGGRSRPAALSAGLVAEGPAPAGRPRGRGPHRRARHRRRCVRRRSGIRAHRRPHGAVGGGSGRLAPRTLARRRSGPRRAGQGREGPQPARPARGVRRGRPGGVRAGRPAHPRRRAGRHADGPACGRQRAARPGRAAAGAVPLRRQGIAGHHRAQGRGGRLRPRAPVGPARLAGLARDPHLLPHRVPQPPVRPARLGDGLPELRARRSPDSLRRMKQATARLLLVAEALLALWLVRNFFYVTTWRLYLDGRAAERSGSSAPALSKRQRSAALETALLLGGALGALGAAELALRALGPRLGAGMAAQRRDLGEAWPNPRWQETKRYGLRLRAGLETFAEVSHGDIVWMGFVPPEVSPARTRRFAFHTDAEGFRNAAVRDPIAVAALGDSFTDAMTLPAEQAWPARLEARLGAPVQNYGTAGFGPQQEERVLEDFALGHRPQAVVLAFFAGND